MLKVEDFGEHQGQKVSLFTLTNVNGMTLSVTNYGCIVTSITLPNGESDNIDVVLGFDHLAQYQAGHPFFGAIAGRFANRIANGCFTLYDKKYTLTCNEVSTGQHLHGGANGFDKYVWQAETDEDSVIFTRLSTDNEAGYPGNVFVKHRIGLTDDNRVIYDFWAQTDAPTIINLVNHSYYNLAGHHRTIESLSLQIQSGFITPVNEKMVPTGEVLTVTGTPYDFREVKVLSQVMQQQSEFDMNYVLQHASHDEELSFAAQVQDTQSNRCMRVYTNQPGLQFYNGFKLSNKVWIGKQGVQYQAYSGLCLETQDFPDSINHVHFPSPVLLPGEIYHRTTAHCFSW